jgi:hypothetical protein
MGHPGSLLVLARRKFAVAGKPWVCLFSSTSIL